MDCTDLVSIITPMYNAGRTIGQTIESVQSQTYTNWEMLIVDDCSEDDSAVIVQRYISKDLRVKYCRQDCNSGVARSRNKGMELAQGRYIAFLDSDDLWEKDKLEKQINFMKEKNAAFCFTGCLVIDQFGKVFGRQRQVPFKVGYKQLLKGNCIACLTVVLDRKIIKDITMPEIPHEDYATWLSILKRGVIAFGINEPLAKYRVGTESVSQNKWRAAKWTWDIYYKYLGMSFVKSSFYFINYIYNAIAKRI